MNIQLLNVFIQYSLDQAKFGTSTKAFEISQIRKTPLRYKVTFFNNYAGIAFFKESVESFFTSECRVNQHPGIVALRSLVTDVQKTKKATLKNISYWKFLFKVTNFYQDYSAVLCMEIRTYNEWMMDKKAGEIYPLIEISVCELRSATHPGAISGSFGGFMYSFKTKDYYDKGSYYNLGIPKEEGIKVTVATVDNILSQYSTLFNYLGQFGGMKDD